MSLISDALKKAQLDRARSPSHHATDGIRSDRLTPHRVETNPKSSRTLFLANIVVLVLICGSAVYLVRRETAPSSPRAQGSDLDPSFAATREVSPVTEGPARLASFDEPIAASAVPVTRGETASERTAPPVTTDYELAGTSALGSNTLLSIIRRADRRSTWIQVGKSVGEITAVSYDPDTDRAVIRVRGDLRTVALRDSVPAAEPVAE